MACWALALLLVSMVGCRSERKPPIPVTTSAPAPARSSEPRFESPEPPELITLGLHIEDEQELALSFALPGSVRFECHELKTRIERGPDRIDIVVLGIARLAPDSEEGRVCRVLKEPPRWKGRLDLPASGRHQLAFHWSSHVDRYRLAVEPEWFDFAPLGKPEFTEPGETGRYLRAGADWLWVTVWFLGRTAAQRLGAKRDALLSDLESLGARPFEPPSGRYLLSGGAVYVPRSAGPLTEEPRQTEEPRFFHFGGDWKQIEALLDRYQKYDPPIRAGGNNMTIWMNQRERHASTYGRR